MQCLLFLPHYYNIISAATKHLDWNPQFTLTSVYYFAEVSVSECFVSMSIIISRAVLQHFKLDLTDLFAKKQIVSHDCVKHSPTHADGFGWLGSAVRLSIFSKVFYNVHLNRPLIHKVWRYCKGDDLQRHHSVDAMSHYFLEHPWKGKNNKDTTVWKCKSMFTVLHFLCRRVNSIRMKWKQIKWKRLIKSCHVG